MTNAILLTRLKNFLEIQKSILTVLGAVLVVLFVVLFAGSCTSKYRPRLYIVAEEGRTVIKPTEMFYVEGMAVSSPLSEAYMTPANGNLAAVSYYSKETGMGSDEQSGFFVQRRRSTYRMILSLPAKLSPGEITLDNLSFVRNFSSVEQPIPARTYLFSTGTFSIDSIKSSDLYTSIDAIFRSLEGDTLKYQGHMKLVPRDRFYFRGVIYQRKR